MKGVSGAGNSVEEIAYLDFCSYEGEKTTNE